MTADKDLSFYIIDYNHNYIPFPPFVHIEAARTTLLKGVSSKGNLRSQYSYHIVTGKLNPVVPSGTSMVLYCQAIEQPVF
jgi:hypothetical protein